MKSAKTRGITIYNDHDSNDCDGNSNDNNCIVSSFI